MTVHIYHEDSHTHGLHDECPRCQEHAEHPQASLDTENKERLLTGGIHTDLDRKAYANLMDYYRTSNLRSSASEKNGE